MEQHPIPRQITTFEFKLVGFMTLHQFIYLLIFIPSGFLLYKVIPVPFLNIVAAAAVSAVGVLLAFLPVNDRPLEVFLQNLYKRLTSPTQYAYQNNGHPALFIQSSQPDTPDRIAAHKDAQTKLSQYLQMKAAGATELASKTIDLSAMAVTPAQAAKVVAGPVQPLMAQPAPVQATDPAQKQDKQPFFIGTVVNNKQKALPEVLVYLKNESGTPVRLLKTNPNGVFATFTTVPSGPYTLEAKDPRGSYLFNPLQITLGDTNPTPITIQEKGLL